MNKKILLIGLALLIIGMAIASFLYLKSNKKININSEMPSVESNSGKIINNEIDGYSVKIPDSWGSAASAEYVGEAKEQFSIKAKDSGDWVVIIASKFSHEISFDDWVKSRLEELQGMRFYSPIIIGKETIGGHEIIKIKDETPAGVFFTYFLKADSKILEVYTDYSEDSVRSIVSNIDI
jgi:hypothetical protein